MRRLFLGMLLAVTLIGSTGCFLPIYSGDPAIRTRELLFTSEDFRNILEEWERIWFLNMPDHMAPQRTHGGII